MSFKSVLDDVGLGLKKFFTSPVTAEVAETGIDVAEIAFPQLTPLLQGIGKSIAVAKTLGQQAPEGSTLSAEQELAIILGDAQQTFQAYQDSTGAKIETDQQKEIIQGLLALLAKIPSAAPATA